MTPAPSRLVKWILSAFIVLNIVTLLAMNRPDAMATWLSQKTQSDCSPTTAKLLNDIPDGLYWFAHKAGLNVKWQMYSYLQRYDFTILAVGIDANGNAVLLPEPLQSERSLFDRFVTDFRETKYQLNIYQYPTEQAYYLSYLRRHYPTLHGMPTRSVRLDLQYRMFVDSSTDALRSGRYFKGPELVVPLNPKPEAGTK